MAVSRILVVKNGYVSPNSDTGDGVVSRLDEPLLNFYEKAVSCIPEVRVAGVMSRCEQTFLERLKALSTFLTLLQDPLAVGGAVGTSRSSVLLVQDVTGDDECREETGLLRLNARLMGVIKIFSVGRRLREVDTAGSDDVSPSMECVYYEVR